MKRIFSLLLILMLVLNLSACKEPDQGEQSDTPPVTTTPEVKDNIDFRSQAEEMTAEDAKEYLEREETDETSAQYKEAVYTVHEDLATEYINESKETKTPTAETKKLFEGIYFKFIEGEGYASQTVKKGLLPYGTYEKSEDGWYRFVFLDRTLAQVSVTQENGHCLNEYTTVLELLLSDPNVTVKPLE